MIFKENVLKCLIYKQNSIIVFPVSVSSSRQRHSYASSHHHHHKDYYKVLNIKRNSTRKEIKLAYYKLSKKYHPDVSRVENSENAYKDIQEAYHVLGDESRKAEYDESIRNGHYSGPGSHESSAQGGESYGGTRAWKKRSGPIYTGRTAHFDYDEHYRGHYGPQGTTRRTGGVGGGFGANSSASMSEEELNNYWKHKEYSSQEVSDLRNRLLFRSSFALLGTVILYFLLKQIKDREDQYYRNQHKYLKERKKD